MSGHPIEGLMSAAMENLKEMIDVNTIIGDPVETPDGSVILTVSKVGFGFAAGGSQFNGNGKSTAHEGGQSSGLPFGGGSGGGVSITPIAFLIVNSQGVKMLHLDENTHLLEKIMDVAPSVIERIQGMIKKNDSDDHHQSNHQSNGWKSAQTHPQKQDLDF
ncbi:GerW family sporulation protein [Heyndrickxia acidicola]|uniref:GerW family sporulation protein n=1 Tax=Heyndrickxia acidicola TaxID=209389 RepID=A0ABU6MEX0_9BACI|nr:GerW family sporulation protein [Heyndrickxia acidicola]MED1203191.1 GerW family sporulation protein [Heyndrickxia acidicola]